MLLLLLLLLLFFFFLLFFNPLTRILFEKVPYYDQEFQSNLQFRVATDETIRPTISEDYLDQEPNAEERKVKEGLINLMRVCWKHKAIDRPGFEQILDIFEQQGLIAKQK